jgi:hypothetical protein
VYELTYISSVDNILYHQHSQILELSCIAICGSFIQGVLGKPGSSNDYLYVHCIYIMKVCEFIGVKMVQLAQPSDTFSPKKAREDTREP